MEHLTERDVPGDPWLRRSLPVSHRVAGDLAGLRYPGRRLACWLHLVPNMMPLFDWLMSTGAELLIGSCDPGTADPAVVDQLRGRGARVLSSGPKPADRRAALDEAVAWRPDLVTEMGGELIAELVRRGCPPRAAMESTTTGIHRLSAVAPLPMPVLNWNDIPLKQLVEHRFHVADALWTAFSALTGIGLLGRRVLVLGYGNVGKGVATQARALGAIVTVADPDPLRLVEARLHGCATAPHATTAAARAEVVVTASGRDGTLDAAVMDRLPDGAILINAGHAPTEFDLDHLHRWPCRQQRPGVAGFTRPDGSHLFVLGDASPLNLAYPHGSLGDDLWDPFNGLMMFGCRWLLDGTWQTAASGLVPFPDREQRVLAELMLTEVRDRPATVVDPADLAPIGPADGGHELREVVGAHLPGSQRRHSLAHSTLRPDGRIPVHRHETTEETFIVAAGSGRVLLDGTESSVTAGQVVVVPPGVRHGFRAGPDGMRLWAVSTPSWTPADHHDDGSPR
ncbi:cupin domain-containing protein [Actinoplanes teichomyceticus]|uniref:Adenosylhomocysteinase n=1 Tax=Actinoplanes teichomyceticus TaxID=1867 RepID=A0A561VIK9_ACTTI|nr:cupin domain-containing protein [Actinoplanes teichomyceticus]TWG11460.1 adenosylhomocysteinase [Actinoplanes teichomyceticus]GIF15726.1 hypothetical protein Ate01nite_57580 [Actinoplanes teichomyceticus]